MALTRLTVAGTPGPVLDLFVSQAPVPPNIGVTGGSWSQYGATVSFAANALDQTYLFSIALPADITKTGYTNVGQCTQFTFPGTTFLSPASLSVPYTASMLPAGKTAADITMLVRDDTTGIVTLLTPSSVAAGLVNLSTSHFSSFQPAVLTSVVVSGSVGGGSGGGLGVTDLDTKVQITYTKNRHGHADIIDTRQTSGKKEGLEDWDFTWNDFDTPPISWNIPSPVEPIPTPFKRTPVDPKLERAKKDFKRIEAEVPDLSTEEREELWKVLLDGGIGAVMGMRGKSGTRRGLGWLRVIKVAMKLWGRRNK